MMGQATLARPYARAAFAQARESGAVDAWVSHLQLAAAIARDPQAARVMGDPRIAPGQLAQLFLPQGVGADDAFARFLATLVENRRLALLPEIAESFAELKREHERVLQVTVRSAVALEVQRERERVARQLDHFAGHHVGQAVHAHDAVGHRDDRAFVARVGSELDLLDAPADQLADFGGIQLRSHGFIPVRVSPPQVFGFFSLRSRGSGAPGARARNRR